MLGAMGYYTSTAFFQDKSLIGMIERDGPSRWLVIYNLDGDFSSQCNQHHRTFSQFDGCLGLYGAKMNPFHSLDIKWDMGIFLGDGEAAARIIYLGKFYDFYFLHIY